MADQIDPKEIQKSLDIVNSLEETLQRIKDISLDINRIKKLENQLVNDGKTEYEVESELVKDKYQFLTLQKDNLEKQIEIHQKILEQTKEIEGSSAKTSSESIVRLNQLKEELKDIEKKIDLEKKIGLQAEKNLGVYRDTQKVFGSMFGIDTRWKDSLIGKIFEGIEKGGVVSGFKSMGSSILALVSPINLLGNAFYDSFSKLFVEQENARAEFVKTTGVAGEYDKTLSNLGFDHIKLGINSQDAVKSIISLRDGYSDFVKLSKSAQEETALFAASMEKLGINSQLTAKNMDISTKVLGMTDDMAKKTQREIFTLATSIGVVPEKMAASFDRMMPKLSVFGDKSIKIFKELSVLTKQTGMEMDKLMGIAEGFDTFESAATSVGKLNAILRGPYLDSIQMVMETDPVERLKNMKNAIDAAGWSFDSMSYYQKKSLMSAIPGMTSVDDLSRLMKGDFEGLNEASEQEAKSQEELNKLIRDARPLMEKMMDIGKQLAAILLPFITSLANGIGWLLDEFQSLNDAMSGWLLKGILILGGALLFLKIPFGSIISLGKGLVSVFKSMANGSFFAAIKNYFLRDSTKAVEESQKDLGKTMEKSGKAAGSSALGMLAFGAAVLMIGGGIFLVIYGLSLLAASMKGMTSGEMVAMGIMLGIIIAAIIALAFVSKVAGGPIALLGLGVLLLGTGISLIFWGISKVIDSMTGFIKMLLDSGKISKGLALNIAFLGVSLVSLLYGGTVAAIGLSALAVGLLALSVSLSLIKTSDLVALSIMFNSISKFSAGTVSALSGVAGAIRDISKAMDEMPEDKSIKFNQMIKTASSITSDKADNVRKLVDQADRYKIISNESKSGITDRFINMISETSKSTASGGSVNGERTIILQMDGRELKRFVINVLDTQLNPKKI